MDSKIKKRRLQDILIIILALAVFILTLIHWRAGNMEFIYYGILTFIISIPFIFFFYRKIGISTPLLIGMSLLVIVNLCAGGIVKVGGVRLYDWILIKLFYIDSEFTAIKFDQIVHAYGGFICSMVIFRFMKYFNKEIRFNSSFFIFIAALAGFGAASFYEVVEFVATFFKINGVGGYHNTLLDMISNFIGALISIPILMRVERRKKRGVNRN